MRSNSRANNAADTARPPNVSQDLINYLDTIFPDRCIRPGMSLQDAWEEAGSRKVIAHLQMLLATQDGGAGYNIERDAL
jgi:hypothetical protein